MYMSKKAEGFSKWLINAKREGLFPRGCLNLKTIEKTKTEIFVANTTEGEPLCVFEVGQEVDVLMSIRTSSFKSSQPIASSSQDIACYLARPRKREEKPIINFRVKKFMPTRALCRGLFP